MNNLAILRKAHGPLQAWRINRLFNQAAVGSAAITARGMRQMARLEWEGKRSPSRLGRASERADQLSAIITPAAGAAVTLFSAVTAGLALYERYEQFRDRNKPKEGNDKPAES